MAAVGITSSSLCAMKVADGLPLNHSPGQCGEYHRVYYIREY